MARKQNPSTKPNMLDAALTVVRMKGYAATTVDDICRKLGFRREPSFITFPARKIWLLPLLIIGLKPPLRFSPSRPIINLSIRWIVFSPMSRSERN